MQPPATPDPQRPERLPARMSVLGLRPGQLIGLELVAMAAGVALTLRGPDRWALGAVAVLGFWLAVSRRRHRPAYEWLFMAWKFRQATKARLNPTSRSRSCLPAVDVDGVQVRSGAEAGVAHDGEGFAVIVAVMPRPDSPPVTELPVAALATMLEPPDSLVTGVQVVIHSDCAGSDVASGPAAAYRSLGYHRIPRSQSTWIVLRHDPAVSGFVVSAVGTPREVHSSLVRSLAGRGVRTSDLLGQLGLQAHLTEAEAARDVLASGVLSPNPGRDREADARSSHRWRSWHSGTRGYITYWLRRWPAGGIGALQQALSAVPAFSVTTAIVATRVDAGQIGLTTTVRVGIAPGVKDSVVAAGVARAAASCGAHLVRMNGEHAAGVMATLPLGREAVASARRLGCHVAGPATVVPVTAGGVVIGNESADRPVAVRFFGGERGTRTAIAGDRLLPRLLALRALGTGARLQVVTAQPDGWMRLRRHVNLSSERMAVVRPGSPQPTGGTSAFPWMIMDDTGLPVVAVGNPWVCVVTVFGEIPGAPGALSGLDSIMLQRTTPMGASAVAGALGLPSSSRQALQMVPDGMLAVATRGSVRFARLAPDPAERAVLADSMAA